MAAEKELSIEEVYAASNGLALCSARILEFRVSNDKLTPAQAKELEKCEDYIDSLVVLIRGYGIKLIGAQAKDASIELNAAILSAKDTLETISDIKKTINIATSLIVLATAVIAKDPKGIILASKGVIDATKNSTSKAGKK